MKKMKVIILFSTLIAASLIGLVYMNTNARRGRRRGRRGGVGFGIRVGVGSGRGYHGRRYRRPYRRGSWNYRRPWYHRPYWGLDTYLGYDSSRKYSNWSDSQNLMYWMITNRSNSEIIVESDTESVKIAPESSAKLHRNRNFTFTVRNIETGKERDYQTKNHVINIGRQLNMRSYIR